jgi:predicted GH43/DUF377 family glycosyl hydrolase
MRGVLALGVVVAACGGGAGSPDAGSDASPDGAIDATPCTAQPEGALTRYSGNPLLRNGPEAYDDLKTGPRVVVRFGAGDYRMWYEAVSSSGITSVAYATSPDGLVWTKQGVVMTPTLAWEKSEVSPNSIVVEGSTLWLYYHGGGYPGTGGVRLGLAEIGLATSTDGMTWTKHGNPVLDVGATGSFDVKQVAEPRVITIGATYRMYYTGRDASDQNALGVATSSDGITWTKYASNPILDATRWGGFWGGAFVYENGMWHLWHATTENGSSIHYKWSTDGFAWNDGPTVLDTNPDTTAPDYGLVGDSVSGYRDGSVYRIMYTGFNPNLFGADGRFEGICAAEAAVVCP